MNGALPAQSPPELKFAAPPGLVSGATIDASVRIAAGEANVLSWSLSVRLEGLQALGTTTAGTDFDRLSQGGFAENAALPDGSAFYTVGVLSFTEPLTLPAGQSELLKVRSLITRLEPGNVLLVPVDSLALPGGDRQISNRVLLVGGETTGLATSPRELPILGCAGFLLALEGSTSGVPFEVRRDTGLDLVASVRIASSNHMSPEGFRLGVSHDPAVLALDSAVLLESFTQTYVLADGFARIETAEAGFAVAILSSAATPIVLPPGDHSFARASYRFVGTGRAGDKLQTVIELTERLSVEGEPAPPRFQPRDVLPCEITKLPLELRIGPDWWIRGDSNGDGKPDISDAIVTLQHLFLGGTVDCARAMDVNLDGKVDISDPISLLAHLFTGGPTPAPPFPDCGAGEETLECAKFPCPAV